ncbi:MAG TPA: hypothetical protein H9962_06060 [Candidatus Mailhella merdigallinarum]|uniref:Transposase n=1 Tax=Candidatus Mailhella merdigallinarum TaxID=2838658 RepID=A0A9D2HDZ3_9BACT|nr:hypothetical protein [Candidatus Mailhella merdigallinarum]
MYERRKKLSLRQHDELINFFVEEATARTTGELVGVHRNTATSYFMRLRRLIASHLPSYRLSGEVEVDESYFGGVGKGETWAWAAGKIAFNSGNLSVGEIKSSFMVFFWHNDMIFLFFMFFPAIFFIAAHVTANMPNSIQ